MKRYIKKLAVSMAVGLACVWVFSFTAKSVEAPPAIAAQATSTEATTVKPKPNPPPIKYDVPVVKTDTMTTWLEDLGDKESENTAIIKVLDNNGYYSYGCLQFQMGTWLSYGKAFGANAENIYDCPLQKKVAANMIATNYLNWKHWKYTILNKGVGLPPR